MLKLIDEEIAAIRLPPKRVYTWRSYLKLTVFALVTFIIMGYCGFAIFLGIYFATIPHVELQDYTPAYWGLDYEAVTLRTQDGVELAAWYIPPQNQAVIILVHGAGGSRLWAIDHAIMLAKNGYGVLMFDARGHGESTGTAMVFGWNAEIDFTAAVAYLETQAAVDHIGAMGLSMGGVMALQATAKIEAIEAVVTDGVGPRQFAEERLVANDARDQVFLPFWWLTFNTTRLLTGIVPSEPMTELVRMIAPRPLLLIAGGRNEVETQINQIYFDEAHDPKTLWIIPNATHTDGLGVSRAEYESRVIGFFDEAFGDE